MNAFRSFYDSPWIIAWLEATTKGFVLLLVAALACYLLRKASAAIRHFVWGLGLAGALVLPAISLVVPVVSLKVPRGLLGLKGNSEPAATEPSVTQARPGETPAVSRLSPNMSGISALPPLPLRAEAKELPQPRESRVTSPNHDRAKLTPEASPTFVAWILAAWVLGVIGALTPMLAGAWVLRRVRQQAQPILDRDWLALKDELTTQLELRRPVALLGSGETLMPMTWGWRKPVVLLPDGSDQWDEARRRAVLLHELAHVQRADCLTQQLAHLACAFHWHNPLAWLAARQMRQERERACDDQVVLRGLLPSEYAAHLVALARSHRSLKGTGLAAVAMARRSRSQLESRVHALLDPRKVAGRLTHRSAGLAFLGLALLLVPLSAFRLHAEDTPVAKATQNDVPTATQEPKAPKTITGLVLDSEGKPIAGAKLAAFAMPMPHEKFLENHLRLVGHAESDGSGKFQMDLTDKSASVYSSLDLVITAQGRGVLQKELDPEKARQELTVRLEADQAVSGRLIDLQGVPAANVSLQLWACSRNDTDTWWFTPPEEPHLLPLDVSTRVTTDSQGRFNLHGFAPGTRITLEVHDDRFAQQRLEIETAKSAPPKDFTFALVAAHRLEGKVTFEDTGKPAAGTKLFVQVMNTQHDNMRTWRMLETDAEGRFQFIPAPGKLATIFAYPPKGSPYLFRRTEHTLTEGKQQQIDLTLRRGIAVRGKVTDAATGLPIARAKIEYRPQHKNNPHFREDAIARFESYEPETESNADGTFQIGVLAGKGNLLIKGPTANYVHIEVTNAELEFKPPGGTRYRPDARVSLDLKPETTVHEVAVTLQPGKIVEGRVVGPGGQPVAQGEIFAHFIIPHSNQYQQTTITFRDGRFSLPGCDPDREMAVYFVDAKQQLGAMAMISGKQAETPLTVKLERCGSVTLRYVDKKGRPYAPNKGRLLAFTQVALSSGPDRASRATNENPVRGETMIVANLDRKRYNDLVPDEQGKITYPTLIPEAPLQLLVADDANWVTKKEFQVHPGENLDLGAITLNDLDKD